MKVFYSWCACALMDFATLTSMNVLRNLVKMELVAIVMSTFTLVNVEVVAMVPIVRSTMKMDVPLSYMNRSTCIGHTINYTCIHAEGSVGTVKFLQEWRFMYWQWFRTFICHCLYGWIDSNCKQMLDWCRDSSCKTELGVRKEALNFVWMSNCMGW